MELERAMEIVAAVNASALAGMRICEPPPDPGASLAEMLEAAAVVRERGDERIVGSDGKPCTRIAVIPDDRLIAAAYASWHFGGWKLGPTDRVDCVCVTTRSLVCFIDPDDAVREAGRP